MKSKASTWFHVWLILFKPSHLSFPLIKSFERLLIAKIIILREEGRKDEESNKTTANLAKCLRKTVLKSIEDNNSDRE